MIPLLAFWVFLLIIVEKENNLDEIAFKQYYTEYTIDDYVETYGNIPIVIGETAQFACTNLQDPENSNSNYKKANALVCLAYIEARKYNDSLVNNQ